MNDIRPAEGSGSGGASPSAFVATGISASLTVNDLAKSVAWYRDVLGFTVEREFERGGVPFATRLSAGTVALLVTQDTGAKGRDRVKGEGFSLRITTRQNIDDIAARARAGGATLESEPADAWGARFFRLRDPDGFLLVISSEQ